MRTPDAVSSDAEDVARFQSAGRSRVADGVGRLLSPLVSIFVVIFVVAHAVSPTWVTAAWWVTLTWGFCAGLPYLIAHAMARRGRIDDTHVLKRSQRLGLIAPIVACVVTGLVLLVVLDAPRAVLALVGAMLTSLLAMAAVTAYSKTSFHAGVAAGAAGIIATTHPYPWLIPLLATVVAAVGWARVRAGRHSLSHVLTGAALGLTLGLGTYTLLTG